MDKQELLQKWMESKQEMTRLQKKCDKYKKVAGKIMNEEGIKSFSSGGLKVSKRTQTREQVTKKSLPKDLWDRYSTSTIYDAYYLTEPK